MYYIPILLLMILFAFDINTMQKAYEFTAWHWLILWFNLSITWLMGYLQGNDKS
jgi:hypothetical protein